MNEYYTPGTAIQSFTTAKAQDLNAEFARIQAAFDRIPEPDLLNQQLVILMLAKTTGAAHIGVAGGGTLQDALDSLGAGSINYLPLDVNGNVALGDLTVTQNAVLGMKLSGSEVGIYLEQHGSGEIFDLRLWDDATATQAAVIHVYKHLGIGLQIDHIDDGFMIYGKNAKNDLFAGRIGNAGLFDYSIFLDPGDPVASSVAQWTSGNVINLPEDDYPLGLSGAGFTVLSVPTADQCIRAQSLATNGYAGQFEGVKYGVYITTAGNDGLPLTVVKNGTGTGILVGLFNHGIGNFVTFYDGSNNPMFDVDRFGQPYIQGKRILSTQSAALPADATDLPSAIALANALKATNVHHGLNA